MPCVTPNSAAILARTFFVRSSSHHNLSADVSDRLLSVGLPRMHSIGHFARAIVHLRTLKGDISTPNHLPKAYIFSTVRT